MFIDTNNISLGDILKSVFLSDLDIASLNKYKMEETRKEKAVSLILKNKYIREYHINEYGKPVSENTYFNISHSKGVVVFIQSDKEIGIDIEKVREVDPRLVDYISSNEEKSYINSDINFFEVWTNKESLTKNIGTGIKDKIKDIPGLPLNGKKIYKGKEFFVRTLTHKNYVISVSRESFEDYDIDVEEVVL